MQLSYSLCRNVVVLIIYISCQYHPPIYLSTRSRLVTLHKCPRAQRHTPVTVQSSYTLSRNSALRTHNSPSSCILFTEILTQPSSLTLESFNTGHNEALIYPGVSKCHLDCFGSRSQAPSSGSSPPAALLYHGQTLQGSVPSLTERSIRFYHLPICRCSHSRVLPSSMFCPLVLHFPDPSSPVILTLIWCLSLSYVSVYFRVCLDLLSYMNLSA